VVDLDKGLTATIDWFTARATAAVG
jgi:hypothetical protein